MDRTVAGLIGAMGALAVQPSHAASPAPRAIDAAMQARSYAELLAPIPNALALSGATLRSETAADAPVERVQYVAHHHHHHRYRRRHYHHHHHHHHHNNHD